jgi:VWFA-related protein
MSREVVGSFPSARRTLTLAVAATVLCAGQQPSPGTESHKLSVYSNLVLLPTRVQNKKGETVYGLRPEQFIVEDNGVRQTVQVDREPDSAGLSLVVVVQCSRSAPLEFDKFKGLAAMVDAIVGDAPREVAVLGYGETPYVLGDFSGSPEAVGRALSGLKPCGDYHAATIDAVHYAIDMLKRRESHYRRAILLISETRDHGSRSKLHEVVSELGISDTVIYCVAFSPTRDEFIQGMRNEPPQPKPPPSGPPAAEESPAPPPAPEPVYTDHAPLFELPPQIMPVINALRRNTASELAVLSGGEYFNFTTKRGFDQCLDRISNRIHNYYVLGFQPASSPSMTLHSLRVQVAGYPNAVIQTRRSYWSGISEPTGGNVR